MKSSSPAIENDIDSKYERLQQILKDMGSIAVAYSGGVDSTFLVAAAKDATDNVIALTMKRPYFAEWELKEARDIIRELGVRHKEIELPVDEEVRNNVPNRCYYCKSSTFARFREEAAKMNFDTLADGTNADDAGEFRPGLKAIKEHNVRSPLQEAGLTKDEIRLLSRNMGLPDWDKPANTCLVTRIPYNTYVRDEDLRMIEQAERVLIDHGFRKVRVRKHDDLARIEVNQELTGKLLEQEMADEITSQLKNIGFTYISVDLQGYKTGSMDQNIAKKSNG
ncbi:ATP-dependent sacrificial sulfur transferase LarE [Natronogracilivirga saccharolytica]|uniref:ATP-dependent sacrificial sulfur transferase LarE n=1 Tax=Natronogracilivirga saccharolytica TaxID=2812953 RepID=A0A8J7RSK8_9BACT|nr:ATP-dependent sacrificial sulfur transferase LarE [Natronogracilivirga saccharolytica]MBP3192177.1 ATP-dependent sacrificial sulfur transferase LarE [Natronogracilivirga saccharolytica]